MNLPSRHAAPARSAFAAFLACLAAGPAAGQTVATALQVGNNHACVPTAAVGVKCSGFNDRGQMDDGTTTNRAIAVDVGSLLKRSPDPAGFPIWVSYLDSGPYLHEYAIDAVLRSAEYRARFVP